MKLVLENYGFLVYMYYYTHPGYQTSIFDKNRAYYSRIFTVTQCVQVASIDKINKTTK